MQNMPENDIRPTAGKNEYSSIPPPPQKLTKRDHFFLYLYLILLIRNTAVKIKNKFKI